MRVVVHPEERPRRGGPVEEGNVYTNRSGRPHYKIVLGKIRGKNYNNVAVLKVFVTGEIAGASCEPESYLRDHQDLVGRVENLPDFHVRWLGPGDGALEVPEGRTGGVGGEAGEEAPAQEADRGDDDGRVL